MKQKIKILFLCEGVTLAHVARPISIARMFKREKYEIFIAAPKVFHRFLKNENVNILDLKCIETEDFENALDAGEFPYSKEILLSEVDEDFKVMNEVKPDIVFGDFRLSMHISARVLKIPSIMIGNIYWHPELKQRFPLGDIPVTKVLGHHLPELLLNVLLKIIFGSFAKDFNKICREYKVKPVDTILDWYTGADFSIFSDIRTIYSDISLSSNQIFVGPLNWSPRIGIPSWWKELDKNKTIIYLAMGSSGGKESLQKIIPILGKMDVLVVFSSAGRVETNNLPDNFYSSDFLPGDLIMQNVDIAITNGGAPTTYQALIRGVPVIGIPNNMDQYLNFNHIVKSGAGIIIRSSQINSKRIEKACYDLLNDELYLKRVKEISLEYQMIDQRKIINRLIEKILI